MYIQAIELEPLSKMNIGELKALDCDHTPSPFADLTKGSDNLIKRLEEMYQKRLEIGKVIIHKEETIARQRRQA